MLLPLLLTIVYPSSNSNVTVTSWSVHSFVEYVNVYFGIFVIQLTLAVSVPSLPALSTKRKVNSPFLSNVYVSEPSLFKMVTSSFGFNVTVTGLSVKCTVLYSI